MRHRILLSVLLFIFAAFSGAIQFRIHEATEEDLCRPSFSEENKIEAILHEIAQAIRKQQIQRLAHWLSPSFAQGDKAITRLRSFFENSKERLNDTLFVRAIPPGPGLTSTWDFDIDKIEVTLGGDRALATCDLIFHTASSSTNGVLYPGPQAKETFSFVRNERLWRLSQADIFFDFLENYGEISTVEDTKNTDVDLDIIEKRRKEVAD